MVTPRTLSGQGTGRYASSMRKTYKRNEDTGFAKQGILRGHTTSTVQD